MFQAGDVFAAVFEDPNGAPGRTTQTVYFKAADPALGAVDNTNTNGTAATPYLFHDLESLSIALNSAFGKSNASFTLKEETSTPEGGVATGTGKYYLGMQLGTAVQSITFGQVSEGGAADALNNTFDFSKMFGTRAQVTAAKVVASTGDTLPQPPQSTGATSAGSMKYSSATAAQTDQTAVDARKQAADFLRQTLLGLAAAVADANLPGFANILKGETMTVSLNDTNTVKQNVTIGGPIDFTKAGAGVNTVGLTSFNVTLNLANGNNQYTDPPGSADAANFLANGQLTNAMTALDNMTTTVGQFQKNLAAAKVAMNSRLDFNKTVVTTLSQSAIAMTAADSNMEAANLAALQNRQAFAVNNMASTKPAEQSLIQILR